MQLKPQPPESLTAQDIQQGKKWVITDGLFTEAMTAFSSGTFLVAMALLMGASNFQIGLLAALPTFTNIFQLLSIWVVRKYNNRRAASAICAILARIPLVIVGVMPLLFPDKSLINLVIFFLFFFNFFGSVAGPCWNSWMKDFIPEEELGTFFSKRARFTQTLNVVLSLLAALAIDYIKDTYPAYELKAYATLFILAGIAGLTGVWFLIKTPEPASILSKENIFRMLRRPLKNANFRNLLMFNAAWTFAVNLATPFFSVFMLTTLGLPLSYVIGLTILSQVSSILTVQLWGRFADKYSNKTIIAIGAPLYILCLIAWCFVGLNKHFLVNLAGIGIIQVVSGFATAGINLSLTNIGLKLAPNHEAVVYLSARNIIVAFFSAAAPLLGGYLADYFGKRKLSIDATYLGPQLSKTIHLLNLHQWNFLFMIGAIIALLALELLMRVQEKGEVEKDIVVRMMRSSIKNTVKDYFIIGTLLQLPRTVADRIRQRMRKKVNQAD
jgi:MFS family permease